MPPLLEEAIDGTVQEFQTGTSANQPTDVPGSPPRESGSTRETESTFQYAIWLIECGDREATTRLGEAIQIIVSALSQTLPLGRLDGITIARDYPAEAEAADRGFDNAPQIETVSPEIGVGMAQMITVV